MINCRGLIVGFMILAAACAREFDTRTYQLTGQVLVVQPDTNEGLVKHDDIPGFMPAMTMAYVVKDGSIITVREKDGTITHHLRTAVIDPTGHVRSIVDNDPWTSDELVRSLKDAVTSTPPAR